MNLTPGQRLGPYEILVQVGAGGMGEVYKARDTRLDRIVAIKTSQEQFSERFAREARAIAALNHPNICQLYDVGPDYLIMEYVEGAPLKGPLPLEKATEYAAQILSALDAAHRKTITHRDLKPGNILVSKQGVKVLDFGLARIAQGSSDSTLTQRGEIVGTPAYMSPEQWNGKPTDARSDIYAFGCVLYEMLTGKRAATDMAGISEVRPPALASIVRDCMKSDPEERWQSVEDIRKALALPAPPAPKASPRVTWLAAASAVIFAIAAVFAWMNRPTSAPERSYRLSILPPEGTSFNFAAASGAVALSPDGRTLAFVGDTNGATHIWLRPLEGVIPRRLDGTEEAYGVNWSPDGRFLAFPVPGKLRRIELATGTVRDLCSGVDVRGMTWNARGDVVFAGVNTGMSRVSANGGDPTPVSELDVSKAQDNHYWPQFLPDGRHLIYASRSGRPEFMGTYVSTLDGKLQDHGQMILSAKRNATYVPDSTGRGGYLLFVAEKSLFAQRFDADKLRTEGEPFAVADDVGGMVIRMQSGFSAANGVLAYWNGESAVRQLTLVTRDGKFVRKVGEPGPDTAMGLSHDNKQVTLSRFGNSVTTDVWIMDVESGISTRVTTDPAMDQNAQWSPDDKELAFTSSRKGLYNLYRRKVAGGEEVPIHPQNQTQWPGDWTASGLIVYSGASATNGDVMAIPAAGGDPIPLAATQFDERMPTVSPSGKFLAFISNDTGSYEVYVQSFPKPGARKRVSTGGAFGPQWRGDSKELYYSTPDNTLIAVDVRDDGGEFIAGPPKKLFPLQATPIFSSGVFWQPMRDGQHFLIMRPAEPVQGKPITIVTNWQAGLKN